MVLRYPQLLLNVQTEPNRSRKMDSSDHCLTIVHRSHGPTSGSSQLLGRSDASSLHSHLTHMHISTHIHANINITESKKLNMNQTREEMKR